MDRQKRKRELRKAIRLVGYIAVSQRIKTPEDKEMLGELGTEILKKQKVWATKSLKEAGISF